MPTLKAQIKGFEDIQRRLLRLETSLQANLILDESAALIFNLVRTRFTHNVNPDLQAWPTSKAAQKRGTITLYDTGRLFRSLQLFSSGPNTRSIGTDVPYAIYHNEGTARLPKREFLGFGGEDISLAARVVARRVQEALK